MKKIVQCVLGAAVVAAVSVGVVGQAHAFRSWGARAPSTPNPQNVSDSNGADNITIATSVFTWSVWATVNSSKGPYTNTVGLFDSNFVMWPKKVSGNDTTNGSIVLYPQLFVTVLTGGGSIDSL